MRLYTAAASRLFDQEAIEIFGLPGLLLMEEAGRAAAEILLEALQKSGRKGVIRILCGPGNNGGDGYVMARYLRHAGWKTQVFVASPPDGLRGDAAIMAKIWDAIVRETKDTEATIPYWRQEDLPLWRDVFPGSAAIVDALLGTGLSREVQGHLKAVLEEIERYEGPLCLAVDLPSGLHADQGRPFPLAFRADITVTFALHKVGLWQASAVPYVGDLRLVEFSTPPLLLERLPFVCEVLEEKVLQRRYRRRPFEGHKGTFGHLLVLAGSAGKTGAALLSSLAALRMGVGLCTLASDPSTIRALEGRILEVMSERLPSDPNDEALFHEEAPAMAVALAQGKDAILLGPGFSQTADRKGVFNAILDLHLPLVLDADGLNLLASDLSLLSLRKAPTILTPHPGEMARLTGQTSSAIQADRLSIARRLAMQYGVILVLKGARTIVAMPDGRAFLNPTGNPGMATAGSGDILAGLISSLLAQGYPAEDAALIAVFLHGAAADQWVQAASQASLIASDILLALPALLGAWEAASLAFPQKS